MTKEREPAPGWPRLLSIELAARYLSVSSKHVYRLIEKGALTGVRSVGGVQCRRLLLDRLELDDLVRRDVGAGPGKNSGDAVFDLKVAEAAASLNGKPWPKGLLKKLTRDIELGNPVVLPGGVSITVRRQPGNGQRRSGQLMKPHMETSE